MRDGGRRALLPSTSGRTTKVPPGPPCIRRASHTLHVGGRGPVPPCAARRFGAVPLRVTAPAAPCRFGGPPTAWRGPPRYPRGPLALCGVRAGRAVARGGSPGLRCGAARPFSGLAGPLLWSRRPGGPCAPAAPRSARPPGLAPALGLALAVRALPGRSGLLRCGLGLGAPRCGLFGGRPCGGPGPPRAFSRGSAPAGGVAAGRGGRWALCCALRLAPSAPPGWAPPPGVSAAALRLRPALPRGCVGRRLRRASASLVSASRACLALFRPGLSLPPPRPCRPAGARGGRVAGWGYAPLFSQPSKPAQLTKSAENKGIPGRVDKP